MEIYNVIVLAENEKELKAFIANASDYHFASEPLATKGGSYQVYFGRLNISSSSFLYLIGIASLTEAEFIWERFAANLLGFIFLINNKNEASLKSVKTGLTNIKSLGEMPYVAAVISETGPAELLTIKKELNIAEERLFSCDLTEKKQLWKAIVGLLNQGLKILRKRSA